MAILLRRGIIPAPSGIQDPSTIFGSNLTAWYKADTGVYKDAGATLAANNDTVQQWNDQSGNGNNLTQATAGARPTFKSASDYNSKNGVDFAVASLTNIATAFQVIPSANTILSGFIVGRMRSATQSFGRALSWITTAALSDDFAVNTNCCPILRDGANNGIASFFNSAEKAPNAISLATNYRLGMVYDGTNITPYVNNVAGTAAASGTVNFGANGALMVGGSFQGNSNITAWDGPILEVVLLKVAPTSTQLNNLDAYFVDKWGA